MDPHAEPDRPAPPPASASPPVAAPEAPSDAGPGRAAAGVAVGEPDPPVAPSPARPLGEVAPTGADLDVPPVVVVLVTHNAGDWFEDTLRSLGEQDYPNLSVLVIDASSDEDPVPRVAAVLPAAYVRRLDGNPGFGAAANEVLNVVEGAAFFAFCHDDVLLEPTAIRSLVEEAFRSNAGIVGPKLVAWGDPRALLQVGLAVDKTGVAASPVERGELDQEQHDAVRDVFYVPGGCAVVRADLFEALGGFDPALSLHGEDLELCWRAHLAGARVLVVPSARVQHREALDARRQLDDRRRLLARHRLRTVLSCYSAFHLIRVLPQAALFNLFEVLYALMVGRVSQARDIAGAWSWNLRRWPELRKRRRQVRSIRQVSDTDLRRLHVRGSARLTAFVRGELGGEDRLKALLTTGRGVASSLRSGRARATLLVWLGLAVVLLFGSRVLLVDRLPALGGMLPLPADPLDLLREYAGGWRTAGVGAEGPAPTAFALLGVAGTLAGGFMALLQTVLVVGMLPLGLLGMWRLVRPLGSWRARLAGVVAYAAVPLPYDAIGRGSWGGLVLHGTAPWMLALLARASRQPPYWARPADSDTGDGGDDADPADAEPGLTTRSTVYEVAALGLVVAVVAAFVPFAILLLPPVAAALALGGLLMGQVRGSGRMLGIAVASSAVAAVLHVPWALEYVLPGGEWAAIGGVAPVAQHALSAGSVLRFETGALGAAPLGWALLVAAALPLAIGSGWRLVWSAQAWTVALVAWVAVWAGGRGWLGVSLPSPEVVLAPAAAALALAVALGMAAFERDLRGHHFGWRQVASVLAACAVAVATLPVLAGSIGGRWGGPATDFSRILSWMPAETEAGSFRVLWIGDPEVLPVGARPLARGLAYGLSQDGPPDALDLWLGPSDGGAGLVADALALAGSGDTSRLGRLLAPFGIRYIAAVDRAAPERAGTALRPVPESMRRLLDAQLDLRTVEVDPALTLYENTAWAPTRAALPASASEPSREGRLFGTAVATDLTAATPVLGEVTGPARFRGPVSDGADIYLAAPTSSRWALGGDGVEATHRKAFGWANAFSVTRGGDATLEYRTPIGHYLAVVLQAALWLVALRTLLVGRVRRREEERAA